MILQGGSEESFYRLRQLQEESRGAKTSPSFHLMTASESTEQRGQAL